MTGKLLERPLEVGEVLKSESGTTGDGRFQTGVFSATGRGDGQVQIIGDGRKSTGREAPTTLIIACGR